MFGLPLLAAWLTVGLTFGVLGGLLTRRGIADIEASPKTWHWLSVGISAGLSSLLVVAMLHWRCQQTEEVRPAEFWAQARVLTQSLLIVLLIATTITDLDSYYIPDSLTISGMICGVLLATISGDLQVVHVWVDWNEAIPQIRGPYLPAWLSNHPHLHGLAWSLAGLMTGAVLTWVVRFVAGIVIGKEALGIGDVMLMGMVGSFLGWQPTVIAFLIAPLCAITIGLTVRLLGGKSYVPYGPYLAVASLIVIFAWRWIWMFEFRLHAAAGANDREGIFAIRRLFGDWLSLAALAGIFIVSLVLLLGLGRIYRMIPGRQTVPP